VGMADWRLCVGGTYSGDGNGTGEGTGAVSGARRKMKLARGSSAEELEGKRPRGHNKGVAGWGLASAITCGLDSRDWHDWHDWHGGGLPRPLVTGRARANADRWLGAGVWFSVGQRVSDYTLRDASCTETKGVYLFPMLNHCSPYSSINILNRWNVSMNPLHPNCLSKHRTTTTGRVI